MGKLQPLSGVCFSRGWLYNIGKIEVLRRKDDMNNKTLRSFVSHSFSAAFVLAAAVRMHGNIGAEMDSAECQ